MISKKSAARHDDINIKLNSWAIILMVVHSCNTVIPMVSGKLYYVVEIFFAVLMLALSFRLGSSPFSRDVREIALWDVLFQVACLLLRTTSYYLGKALLIKSISYGIFMLYTWRVYWCARSRNRTVFVGWPVFGWLGWRERVARINSPYRPSRNQAIAAWVSMALCFPVGYVLARQGIKFIHISLFCLPGAIVMLYWENIFVLYEKISGHHRASEQALAEERKQKTALSTQLAQATDELARKSDLAADLASMEAELKAALASVVDLSRQVQACAVMDKAFDQAQLRVDALLGVMGDQALSQDVIDLLNAYKKIRRDMQPDFLMLAKTVAEHNPAKPVLCLVHSAAPLANDGASGDADESIPVQNAVTLHE